MREQPDLVLGGLEQLIQPRGGLERVALAAPLRGAARVGRLLHRVDAGDAHPERMARAVTVDVGVERVAVGDEGDLAGPDVALRPAGVQQAAAARGGAGGRGDDGEGEQRREGA